MKWRAHMQKQIYRVPTAFLKKKSWPIKKKSWPIFNKFSGKNSRPKIYLINSTHQKYLQLRTCDVVQHMHLCGLEKCLLFIKRLLKFTNLLLFIEAEDNVIGSFSVDAVWDRPNDEEVEGNGSDCLGLCLLIVVCKVLWTRP